MKKLIGNNHFTERSNPAKQVLLLHSDVESNCSACLCLRERSRWQYYLTDKSQRFSVMRHERNTQKKIRKHDTRCPVLILRYGHRILQTIAPIHQTSSKFHCISGAEDPSHNVQDSEDCDRNVHLSLKTNWTDTVFMQNWTIMTCDHAAVHKTRRESRAIRTVKKIFTKLLDFE